MQVEHELTGSYPLSPQQRRVWSLHHQQSSAAYRVQGAILIEGALDSSVLALALRDVVACQEVLRTTFAADESHGPMQRVAEEGTFELRDHDVRGLSPRDQEDQLSALLREESSRAIGTYDVGPRFLLVRQSAAAHTLLVTLSAMHADAATLKNLVQELGGRYGALLKDEGPPDDAVQYADLSEWQNGLLEAEDARGEREFWRRQLDAPSLALRLPLEMRAPAHSPFRLETTGRQVDRRVTAGLDELAARYGTSLSVLLLTCWQVLLCRITGQWRLIVGVALDGRSYEGLERAMGPLTKYLPLLTSFGGNERFSECLGRTIDAVRVLSDMQEYFSWEHVLSEIGEAGNAPYIPLCYDFNEYGKFHAADTDLTFSITHSSAWVDRWKIKLSCSRTADALFTELHYDASIYEPADIERLLDEFHTILRHVVEDPECAIDRLQILGEKERRQVLEGFNQTPALASPDLPLHHLFEQQAARTPNAPAVSCGEVRLTYGDLNERAEELAEQLRRVQVGRGEVVGLCVERSAEMLVGLLGIWKAGGAYLPLDPEYPVERLRVMVNDAGARTVVAWGKAVAAARAATEDSGASVVLVEGQPHTAARGTKNCEVSVGARADDLAYVIYTSGSTGVPKGVCVEHRSLVNYLGWVNETLLSGAVRSLPVVTSLSFDMCLKQLLPPLLTGNEVWLVPDEVVAQPHELVRALSTKPKFSLNCVPSLWKSILDSLDPTEVHALTDRFACLLFGGERLSESLVKRTFELLPRTQVWNIYGPTEVTANATGTVLRLGEDVTIGRPISNVQVYILDEYLDPVPIGVVGEMYVGGSGVARGYRSRPESTAESFVSNPFDGEPGGRLYKTGDRARFLTDGKIDFVGRMDHQVKVRGYRIELGEIEAALEQHHEIREAVVLAREDTPGDIRLVAYVVSELQPVLAAGELREYLQTRLPWYMVPASFVTLGSLPRTPNGKVDRGALPAPERAESTATIAPRTPEERLMVEVWAEVLGLDVERVGVEDNFFELGGDSILSIQVVARAGRRGLRLTPRQIFDHQTIAGLAASVSERDSASAARAAYKESESENERESPLTPIQRRFFEQEQPDPHHFNQAVLLRTRPDLSADVLERALRLLVARHDALRLRFTRDEANGEWRQRVVDVDHANDSTTGDGGLLWRLDLTGVAEGEKFAAEVEHQCGLAQRSLNLKRGPLLRAVHLLAGDGRWGRLFIAVHHLAVDGVSWRVLLEELSESVEAFAAGKEPGLGPQTATWVRWARELAAAAWESEVELPYWRGLPWARVRRMAVDSDRGNTVSSARTVERELTRAETAELLTGVATAYRARVDEALLAALARAYPRWLSERDEEVKGASASGNHAERPVLLVELEGHGREVERAGLELDLSRTVGWFTSVYPVALEMGDGIEGVSATLLRAKEAVRGTPGGGLGWGLLKYVTGGGGLPEVREWPRAEVSVNYLGRFDNVVAEGGPFAGAQESGGALQSERGMRQHFFDINSIVMHDRLRVSWTYSENLCRRESVELLADLHLKELRAIIEHCQSPEAGSFAPSDFPEANLNQEELELFISSISAAAGKQLK